MTIKIKRPLINSKLEKAEKKIIANRSKQKGFDARKFSANLTAIELLF